MASALHFARLPLLPYLAVVYALWLALWVRRFLAEARLRSGAARLTFSVTDPFEAQGMPFKWRLRMATRLLRPISIALLGVALLGPQHQGRRYTPPGQGIDIMLAIDTSQSMQALDLDTSVAISRRKSRLQVVQGVVADFVKARTEDSIGVIVFGSDAFLQCPLTLDHQVTLDLLATLHSGMAGDSTAIGAGIAASIKRLTQSRAKSKIIILLTDGRNNGGAIAPRTAAEMAAALGIKIYTVGAGSHGRAPFVVDSPIGPQVVYDEVDIDDAALTEVAQLTQGQYFRAEDQQELISIYKQIDALEKSEVDHPIYFDIEELFGSFVAAAFLLFATEVITLGTLLAKSP